MLQKQNLRTYYRLCKHMTLRCHTSRYTASVMQHDMYYFNRKSNVNIDPLPNLYYSKRLLHLSSQCVLSQWIRRSCSLSRLSDNLNKPVILEHDRIAPTYISDWSCKFHISAFHENTDKSNPEKTPKKVFKKLYVLVEIFKLLAFNRQNKYDTDCPVLLYSHFYNDNL